MDKTNILDSDNFKEKIAKTNSCCNDHTEYLNETICAFKESLSSMQKRLEIMHCEIDNFFSSSDCVLSGLMSNINKLEDKIKKNESDLIVQKNNKDVADKINIIDHITIKLSEEISIILLKTQNNNYCITDEELYSLETQYEYLLQIRGEVENIANKDLSVDLVQQKSEQAQKNKPIYDEIALQINNIVNKYRANKYVADVISNISKSTRNIHEEIDFIITQKQNITYEEIQQNIADLAKKKEILEENRKSLDEAELETSLDQLVRNKSDLFEHIQIVDDKINLEIEKLTSFVQSEIVLNDLINYTNNSADSLILYIDRISEKVNKHGYESVSQLQEEFDLLQQQAELLNQQKDSLVKYTGLPSEGTARKRNESLQYVYSIKEKIDIVSKILQDELQKVCYAKNVIDNFKDFIFSLEQEVDLICAKVKNNHYASIHDGINELINKQQGMQDRQIELNNIRENLIPNDLLKKKMETSRKFIDIQEKISHFLLDIKIFNA